MTVTDTDKTNAKNRVNPVLKENMKSYHPSETD